MTPTLPDNLAPLALFKPIKPALDRNDDHIRYDPKKDSLEPALLQRVNKFYFKTKENAKEKK